MFLYYIFITPIEKILEWVFYYFIKMNCSVFTAIFGVSIVMNFLALPLYRIADALQNRERDAVRKMEPMLNHIRRTFKGDERFMMISTFYRQNHYHPLYVIRSSLSILITVPFFIAGYHFLSHCPELTGQKFWIFKDLGSPDKIWVFKLFGLKIIINILPIVMTLINLISTAIYTQKGTFKEKIQTYALALIFLVLLYNSPAGLVIYWILNNLFSLVKNVIMEKQSTKVLCLQFIGMMMLFGSWCKRIWNSTSEWCRKLPSTIAHIYNEESLTKTRSDFYIFIFSAAGLAILLGFLLPASVIDSSPLEFSFLGDTPSPFAYIWTSLFTFIGLCIVWPVCFYLMFGDKVKFAMSITFFTLLVCAICNAYLFAPDYGDLNPLFLIEKDKSSFIIPFWQVILSFFMIVLCVIIFFVGKHYNKQRIISIITFSLCIGMFGLSIHKCFAINKEYKYYCENRESSTQSKTKKIESVYHLSKDGKNVVILFLDRAMSCFLPYVVKEFPRLKEQFDGFVYYPNTVSFGAFTHTGSPAMFGGYEYTPEKMNERKDELLKDKHNEACLVMPKLFADAGYSVSLTNIPWVNYSWSYDTSLFKSDDRINAFVSTDLTEKYFKDSRVMTNIFPDTDKICRNRIASFSILETICPVLRKIFYIAMSGGKKEGNQKYGKSFLTHFSWLYFLRELTAVDNKKNSFILIGNKTTHEEISLNVPEYISVSASETVEYNNYKPAYKSDDILINKHYQINVAALLQVAKWIDYLKKNHVYDNTRIIIVSDHGRHLKLDDLYTKFKDATIPARFNPLLMVKDFDSRGNLKTDDKFMTNADTLFIAKEGLGLSDTNPITKKKLEQDKSNGATVYVNGQWNMTKQRDQKKFQGTSARYLIKDNLFNPYNWTKIENK